MDRRQLSPAADIEPHWVGSANLTHAVQQNDALSLR
jgi:hypothetical protein